MATPFIELGLVPNSMNHFAISNKREVLFVT
jgi:hypothetical protein